MGEQGERVVAARRDRQAHPVRPWFERLEENVGILPALRVPDAGEVGVLGGLSARRSPPVLR
jgi:hypothetical protein